jgi:hypothetical protein
MIREIIMHGNTINNSSRSKFGGISECHLRVVKMPYKKMPYIGYPGEGVE